MVIKFKTKYFKYNDIKNFKYKEKILNSLLIFQGGGDDTGL